MAGGGEGGPTDAEGSGSTKEDGRPDWDLTKREDVFSWASKATENVITPLFQLFY